MSVDQPPWGLDAARSMSYGEQLARAARTWPDEVVIRNRGESTTFSELDQRVNRLAQGLRERGVAAGDRVAVLMFNRPEVIEAYLAALRLGAMVVPVNFRLAPPEIAYVLEHSGAVALVVDGAHLARAREAVPDAITSIHVVDASHALDGPREVPYEETVVRAAAADPRVLVDETEPAFLMYTSGTTGRPKGAVLTHRNLLMASLMQLLVQGGLSSRQVELVGVPLFHIAGVSLVLRSLLTGNRLVMNPQTTFDPVAALDLLERERVTSCFFVPSQWADICRTPGIEDRDLSLQKIFWGGSSAPPSVLRAMAECFPEADAYCGFGQTEMSPTTCMLRGEDAIRKLGSVGRPLPSVEIRLVDDHMQDVPVGEVGEIVYRGPTVMKEYWRDEEATREAFAGGWFHSGDLCRMDADGFLWVVDRKKDMIVSGGENIYCAEVEGAIDSHPGVSEVAVVGAPHDRWGETPVAIVVPADPATPPTEDELIGHCRTVLASYKKPTRVIVVDELPRTPTGKVQKFRLRALVDEVPVGGS